MSLRAWFQLNGDLSNKGISNAVATNDGATVDNNGKIGKCYAFNNTRIIIDSTDLQNIFTSSSQPFSFATWIYLNSDETDRVIIFGNYNANPFINWELLGNGTHRLCAGGTSNFTTKTNSTVVPKTTWTHIAVTYDGTITTFYQNGISIGTASGANTITTKVASSRFYLGSDTRNDATRLKGKLCDFRCYDHCLSAAEVREIAQGLVLHYKLDGGLFGNPNLLLNTHFDNRYNQTTGWDTTKNGTLLAYSWGGYNPGVANQATCYHAHLKLFNNECVYEYIKDTETWLGISQGGLQSKLIAGKTYTFSCEQYSVTNTNYMYGGLYYYKTGATSAGFHLGYIYCNTNRQQNTWQKYTYTFTAPSDGDYSKNMIWYCYGHSGGAGTFYLRHLKLEEGNAATPWCPADSELDIDRTVVEDSSGYNHNGTIVGDLIPITDTKRYTIATKWNSSAPTTNNNTGLCYIQTPLTLTTPSQMTVTWWGKPESGYGGSTGHAVFCTSNNETAPTDYNTTAFHHRDSGFDIYPSDGSGVKRLSFSYTKNEWHHYAVTYDGTTARTYQDGELKSSITVGANKTLASFSQLYIGFSKAGGIWRKTLGSYSDFRIYITQLLDTDIKQLYNVGMKVDKGQNVHTFEFNESAGKTQFLKTGVIKSAQIADNLLFDNKAHIGKHSYENILPNNVNIVTTKNGHITNQGTLASISAEKMQSLAGKTLRLTYDVKADGTRSSAENNQTAWNYIRYGIHGSFQYTNASGTTGTSYPFAGDLAYSGIAKRSTQIWTIPTGYQSYGALGFSIQAFDKPASTNDETWFIQNVRLEIIDTTSDGYVTGTQIIEK